MPSFEQIADTGMFWNALEEEEVVKTVLPVKATKEEVVVESADGSELEYSTDVPLQRAIFKTLRFSECLYSDMSYMCSRKTNSTKKDAFFKEPKKASALAGLDTCGRGHIFLISFIFCTVCTLHLQNKYCVKGKSQYFTWRFEFPARAKLVRSTITFFSVHLFFFVLKR